MARRLTWLLVFVLFLLVAVSSKAAVIAHMNAGGDVILVHDEPCNEAKDAGKIELRRAGVTYMGCWQSSGPMLLVKWDDGDRDEIPMSVFKVGPMPIGRMKWSDT